MRRSRKAFQIDRPNCQIIILLLIGVFVLTMANAAGLAADCLNPVSAVAF
jgi:hypothetical protein